MSNPKHWMQTYTGRAVRFDAPWNLEISIQDIARPLSRLPRFGGHTTKPLSVAEHSVAVSFILERQENDPLTCLHGLMHDAHEAFTGDMVAPLKRHLRDHHGFDIAAIQAELQVNIYAAFDIPLLSDCAADDLIHDADLMACKIERDMYMASPLEWDIDHIKYPREYRDLYIDKPASPADAMGDFIKRFRQLEGKLNA